MEYITKNRVINTKKLLSLIYGDLAQQGVKPVPTPPAHMEQLWQPDDQAKALFDQVEHLLTGDNTLTTDQKAMIELMFVYGLRVSEVLSIEPKDVSITGHIYIHGKKGSNDRIIYPSIYKSYWLQYRQQGLTLGQLYSRFYMYRLFKKYGINYTHFNGIYQSVTHALRHLLIKNNKKEFNNTNTNKNFIGHKSIKSTVHYENRK